MTDTPLTPAQIDEQIAQLQAEKNQLINAQFEQQIYDYFSKLPQDQLLTTIGKLLSSNPMMRYQVQQYMQQNPITPPTPPETPAD